MDLNSSPCPEDCDRLAAMLKPRRRKAKQHPLSAGDTLTFDGPTLRTDVFPHFDRPLPTAAAPSALPRRPVNRPLLDDLQHAPPTAGHRLTLKQPIQAGKNHFAQVWRVDVEEGGRREPAVLKLFVEALFPSPGEQCSRAWQGAEAFAKAEADSYAAFSALQGSAVPYCYGVYRFSLPFGETVDGILLEDLSDLALPLPTWLDRQRAMKLRQRRRARLQKSGNDSEDSDVDSSDSEVDADEEVLELEEVKVALDCIFGALSDFHAAGRAHFRSLPVDILIIGSSPAAVYAVKTGYATSCSTDEIAEFTRRMNEDRLAQYGQGVVPRMIWQELEQSRLFNALEEVVGIELMEQYQSRGMH